MIRPGDLGGSRVVGFAAQKRPVICKNSLAAQTFGTSATVTVFCLVGGHERSNLVSIVFISVFSSPFPLQKPPDWHH